MRGNNQFVTVGDIDHLIDNLYAQAAPVGAPFEAFPTRLVETLESDTLETFDDKALQAAAAVLHAYINGEHGDGTESEWARLDAVYTRVMQRWAVVDTCPEEVQRKH